MYSSTRVALAPRPLLLPGILGLCAILLLALTTPTGAAIPNPTVIGPIPATAPLGDPSHNYPFFATDMDLASHGYIEEEYFIKGTANQYTIPTVWDVNNPESATATIRTTGNPYQIRMLVRRPLSAKKFNGTVIVDWMNVTSYFEYYTEWIRTFDYILRTGAIYVGVGVQRAGIHTAGTGLKAWNPTRYKDLDVTVNGTIMDDSLRYDILSQAMQALRQPVGIDPLGGLRPKVLIASGDSQSASGLAIYANSVHVLDPIFDVFVPTGSGSVIRTDLTTKYFILNSEYDTIRTVAKNRRPDTERYVSWEIAGASHTDYHNWLYMHEVRFRDLGNIMSPPGTSICVLPARSQVRYYMVLQAAFDHAVRWVTKGVQPPEAPRIEIADWTTTPLTAARDSYGIAKGGIRLADVVVPTALNTGWNKGWLSANDSTCGQQGIFMPFLEDTEQQVTLPVLNQPFTLPALDELYRNHGTYVEQVTKVTNRNVKDGYLLKEDGQIIHLEAAKSEIGK